MVLAVIGFSAVQAQDRLIVKEKTGSQIQFSLNTLRKLSFPLGNMELTTIEGGTSSFLIKDIQVINFDSSIVGVNRIETKSSICFSIYPIPAKVQLNVSYEAENATNVNIEIIDLLGKVLYNQNYNSQTGKNLVSISIAELPEGLYLCQLQKGNKIETVKFVKN
jgi:hypothetical protein